MALFSEHADVSVRPATDEDAAAITRVQLRAWRAGHAASLGGEALEHVDVAAVRDAWASAVAAPPSPAHRVLVACDGPRVIGFAASAPTGEGGVEVVALEVDPDHQRGGHGSRLLTACVDLARADGATTLQTWVLDDDEGRARFLDESGLAPDGTRRDLEVEASRSVTERRWAAEL
jgi:ribosomal protein S18 acetylase RimI-like enzyme